ncbi:hypothetical protein VNI00_010172 [Paramarasmius palmivorus]|uniref:Uncharacterized protein n=1 Tax=Paramarasmius palmivorus TaxID=297713 RepID=A0AAW0CJG6_9AGAR
MKLLNTYLAFSAVFSVSATPIENQVGPQLPTDSRAFKEIKNAVAPSNETSEVALSEITYRRPDTTAEAIDARAMDFSERSLPEHSARGIDDGDRGSWTQNTMGAARDKHPGYNGVIVGTKHTVKWEGIEYVDWMQQHVEYHSIVCNTEGTLRYVLYLGKAGDFVLEGDGGYINWALAGKFVRSGPEEKHVVFS